jgi:hypothetical protein
MAVNVSADQGNDLVRPCAMMTWNDETRITARTSRANSYSSCRTGLALGEVAPRVLADPS